MHTEMPLFGYVIHVPSIYLPATNHITPNAGEMENIKVEKLFKCKKRHHKKSVLIQSLS
uniref:Uncharacterized protein n=1 Tax=Rhizophora mucronata TaxID=61149 RepID=A0A2P2KDD9_RHIMU